MTVQKGKTSAKNANQLEILHQERLFNLPVSKSQGREFVSRGRTYYDFCSTNYLGYDFNPYVHQKAMEAAEQWGGITSWSRMEADCNLYTELEERINRFVGCDESLLGLTITSTGMSLIPGIVEKGIIFADSQLHTVVWEACRLARDHGSQLVRFRHQDLEHLEALLREHENVSPKLIGVDGVYSISTELAPIRELQALCRQYNAFLYVDDAHGFGIFGRNPNHGPVDTNPYGIDGSGVINHLGGDYDRTFYVTSFGKAFCNQVAFSTIPKEFKKDLKSVSTQYLFSGPCSPYLIGATHAVLDLNEKKGEQDRAKIRSLVDSLRGSLADLGYKVLNTLKHPVVYLEIGPLEAMMEVARRLDEGGILAGLRAYPVVPPDRCGFRFALTALNEQHQIDRILNILSDSKFKGMRHQAGSPTKISAA